MPDKKGVKRPRWEDLVRGETADMDRLISMIAQEVQDEIMCRLFGGSYDETGVTMRGINNMGRHPADWHPGLATLESESRPTGFIMGPGDLRVEADDATMDVVVYPGTAYQYDTTGCDDDDAAMHVARIPAGTSQTLTVPANGDGVDRWCGVAISWNWVDYNMETRRRKASTTDPEVDYNMNTKRRPDCRSTTILCDIPATGGWAATAAAVAAPAGYFLRAIIKVPNAAAAILRENVEHVTPHARLAPYLGGVDCQLALPCHHAADRTPTYGRDMRADLLGHADLYADYRQGMIWRHFEPVLTDGAWHTIDNTIDWRNRTAFIDVSAHTAEIRANDAVYLYRCWASVGGAMLSQPQMPIRARMKSTTYQFLDSTHTNPYIQIRASSGYLEMRRDPACVVNIYVVGDIWAPACAYEYTVA